MANRRETAAMKRSWDAFVRFQKKHPKEKGLYRVIRSQNRITLKKYTGTLKEDSDELIEFPLRARNTLRLVQKAIRESEDYTAISKLYRIFNYTSRADVNECLSRLRDDGKILIDKKTKTIFWIYASPAKMKRMMNEGTKV